MAANTPENKVKAAVKKVLATRDDIYGWWPVPMGFGTNSLDYVGCVEGLFFAIETKAPGKYMTALQEIAAREIIAAGGIVFVIDAKDAIELVWLDTFLKDPAGWRTQFVANPRQMERFEKGDNK